MDIVTEELGSIWRVQLNRPTKRNAMTSAMYVDLARIFNQAAKDFAQLARTPLTMPVLAIGGEKSLGEVLGAQMKSVARDVTVIVLKNTGHWILEENTRETTDALTKFL